MTQQFKLLSYIFIRLSCSLQTNLEKTNEKAFKIRQTVNIVLDSALTLSKRNILRQLLAEIEKFIYIINSHCKSKIKAAGIL